MTTHRKRYNVVAAFEQRQRAEEAVDSLERGGIPRAEMDIRSPGAGDGDRRAESYAEMHDEVDGSFAGPSLFATGDQAKGALIGLVPASLVGAMVGLVVGLVWAMAGSAGSDAFRILLPTIAFAVGGATAGFVAGGALKPRLSGQRDDARAFDDARTQAERSVLVAVHTDDEQRLERAAGVLRQMQPERMDFVHADGTPLPSQADSGRPADPDQRWWKGPTGG